MSLNKQNSAAEIWYSTLASRTPNILNEPWTDLFAPEVTKDVAVHHEKMKEVKEACMLSNSRKGRIVVITGPPGSSKSTCLRAVCKSLGFSAPIVWEETSHDFNDTGFTEFDKFEEFLLKSTRYSSANETAKLDFRQSSSTLNLRPPQLVLFENLPSDATDKPARFHNILRTALSHVLIPTLLAFVLTKSSYGIFGVPNTSNFDNSNLGRLFPPKIIQELGVLLIEFNPIAPTIMTRAVNRIVNIVCQTTKVRPPSRSFIQRLTASSAGDIRLAVNNLQFALMSANSTTKLNGIEDCVFQRDTGLALFHALGKILYTKRLNDLENNYPSLLPSHLQDYKRAPLSFNPELVLDQSGLAGDDAVAWLHENYLSFHTNTNMESFDSLAQISTQLSWADAHLSGDMNWRLGLTPAADRNSGVCMAGSHYAAMVTARCIAFRSPAGGGRSRFRPLKAPQSKSVDGKIRESLEALKISLFESSGLRYKEVMVAGLRTSLLHRFPSELMIMGDKEIISSICLFPTGDRDYGRINKRRADHFSLGTPRSAQRYHLYDDETEGCFNSADLEVKIDENFSDEESR